MTTTAADAMTVGTQIVKLCNQKKFLDAVNGLYAQDIVSVEPVESPGHERTLKGLDKVRAKTQRWIDNHEIHSTKVVGPFPHEDRFTAMFTLDVTPKTGPMAGKRFTMDEIGLYTVKDGKVTREEFFYAMG